MLKGQGVVVYTERLGLANEEHVKLEFIVLNCIYGNSLVVKWLRLLTSTEGDIGSIPG